MKFKDLKLGQEFTVYGDQHLNYNYPKICRCKKVGDHTCEEIEGPPGTNIRGCRYAMNGCDEVDPVEDTDENDA